MMAFDAAERAAILQEYDRIRAEPRPASKGPVALLLAAGGVITLIVVPRVLHPSGGAAIAVLALSSALLAAAALLWVFGRSAEATFTSRAEDAIGWLVSEFPGEADERRRAAVAALTYAFVGEGPARTPSYDFAAAGQQLGAALEYVQAVEAVLRESGRLPGPVFT